jgi:hypothetical protein
MAKSCISRYRDAITNAVLVGVQMLFELLWLMTLNNNWSGGE